MISEQLFQLLVGSNDNSSDLAWKTLAAISNKVLKSYDEPVRPARPAGKFPGDSISENTFRVNGQQPEQGTKGDHHGDALATENRGKY